VKYAVVGHGRMGRAVDAVAASRGHRRHAVLDPRDDGEGAPGIDAASGADVAFEFTQPDAAEENVLALVGAGIPVVCGTTGWSPGDRLAQALAATNTGMVLAPNFSIGVNLFFRIVDHASRLLGGCGLFDPYVQEIHHRGKKDAPSGTARRLVASLLAGDPRLGEVLEGRPDGGLPGGAVQIVSIRAGGEPGSHTVGFDGEFEGIVLEHRSRSREGFALGAVLAAEWLGRRPGLHVFEEVLDDILESRPEEER
jgi:4-hydroxy-tetrahydrodipicolinate reductase